jgi:hypothetical protein
MIHFTEKKEEKKEKKKENEKRMKKIFLFSSINQSITNGCKETQE